MAVIPNVMRPFLSNETSDVCYVWSNETSDVCYVIAEVSYATPQTVMVLGTTALKYTQNIFLKSGSDSCCTSLV